jgi:hypothetical protein
MTPFRGPISGGPVFGEQTNLRHWRDCTRLGHCHRVLLSGSRGGTVIVRKVADGSERAAHQVHKFDVGAKALSPGGQ